MANCSNALYNMSIADSVTRMMNSIDELYPILRFLRVSRYNDWKLFSMEIGKVSEHCQCVTLLSAPSSCYVSTLWKYLTNSKFSLQNTKTRAHAIGR
jgi:hypothetical protein